MFTGIVTHRGDVARAAHKRGTLDLKVRAPIISRELHRGDSVAVNGVCLTATSVSRRAFEAQATGETLARSTLETLRRGSEVNLELPARLADRIGGHLVQGHVDGVARVMRVEDEDGALRVWLTTSEELLAYMVPKGSVALDGVSLTILEVGRSTFQVTLIPYTLTSTTLRELEVGSVLNLEIDVIAKYVRRFTEEKR